VATGLVTQSGLTPGGNRTSAADGSAALTTAVGVVVGVHDRTANGGTPAHVALTASLTDVDVLVLDVTNLADGSHAVDTNDTNLAGGHTDLSIVTFLSHQLSEGASGTNQLSAVAGMQLDVVDDGTDGDVCQRQSVTGQDVSLGTGHDDVTSLQANGSQDVAQLAVLVLDQSDVSGTVGIVLQVHNSSGAHLVALEVDDTILALVAAAAMTDGDAAIAVTARVLLQGFQQASLGLSLLIDASKPETVI